MNSRDVEVWALQVIERVKAGLPAEDARVELKAEWPEAARVARRLAGHANAARGERILWLIGVDEKGRRVVGAEAKELSAWWDQVKRVFSELPPSMTDAVVPVDGTAVVALAFDTDRAPYVVATEGGGRVELEVPWREATGTRSARRSELLTILAPTQRLPEVEVLDAYLSVRSTGPKAPAEEHWRFEVDAYFVPLAGEQLVVPTHRCRAVVVFLGADNRLELDIERFFLDSDWAQGGPEALIASAPTVAKLRASRAMSFPAQAGPVTVQLLLSFARVPMPLRLTLPMDSVTPQAGLRLSWRLRPTG